MNTITAKNHLNIFAIYSIWGMFFSILLLNQAVASDYWEIYESETQLFSAPFPNEPNEKVSSFRIGNGILLQSTEALSFIDQRPYKDVIKNYVVKFDQTFGPAITRDDRIKIIEREFDLYKRSYSGGNIRVVDRKVNTYYDRTTGTLSFTYEDKNNTLQGFKVLIIVTRTSKAHQLFSGPAKDLKVENTKTFFDSLVFQTGIVENPGTINAEWRRLESPFNLFTMKIPAITPPYFNNEPSVTYDDKSERIGMVFTDPIWAQKLFYSVSGYRFNDEVSFESAEEVLLEKHLKRHGRNGVGIDLKKSFIGENPYIQTSYVISPPKAFPYVNHVRIRSFFLGNYMIVQEVSGPRHLVISDFSDNFLNLIEFTPKKAYQTHLQNRLDSTETAPITAE